MKHIYKIFMAMLALLCAATACSDQESDLYNSLPGDISKFVVQYFPGYKVSSYTTSNKGSTVVLTDGPTLSFDTKQQWVSVDGDGSVLPQVLLFDQLPPALYQYLQQENDLANVFSISRSAKTYMVTLLQQTLTYDIDSGSITGNS